MAFDPSTAQVVKVAGTNKFDPSTATNQITGEPAKQDISRRESSIQATEEKIKQRGGINIVDTLQRTIEGNILDRTLGSLASIGLPVRIAETMVTTPVVELQKAGGTTGGLVTADVAQLARSMPEAVMETLKGKRATEFGDILRNEGVPESVAATVGLSINLMLGGMGVVKASDKISKAIVQKADAKALGAVDDLVSGSSRASVASKAMTDSFWSQIDGIPVNGGNFLQLVRQLPKSVKSLIEKEFGDTIENVAFGKVGANLTREGGVTLGTLRRVKQIIGKVRPNAFSPKAADNAANALLNKTYGEVSRFMESSMKTLAKNPKYSKLLDGKVDELLVVNNNAENVINAVDRVRSTVLGGKGEKRTEAAIKAATTEGGADFRQAISVVQKVSKQAMPTIVKGINTLNHIAKVRSFKRGISHAGKALGTAVLIGGVFSASERLKSGGSR